MKTQFKLILCLLPSVLFFSCQQNSEDVEFTKDESKNLIAHEHCSDSEFNKNRSTPFTTGTFRPYQNFPMSKGQKHIDWAVKNLEKFFGVKPITYNWKGNNTFNMSAYRNPDRVFIGEKWWLSMLNNYDAYTAKSIIAHEFGHILQYNNNWYWNSTKNFEIGADFFAGYWLANKDGQYISWRQSSNAFNNFYAIGSPPGSTHGTRSERRAAAKLGYYTGYYANSRGFLGWDRVYKLLNRYWHLIVNGNHQYSIDGYHKDSYNELTKGLSKEELKYMDYLISHYDEIKTISKGEKSSESVFNTFVK